MKLKVGQRVKGNYEGLFTGTVFCVEGSTATIKRDDKKCGTGKTIPDYGQGWCVGIRPDGTWGSTGCSEDALIILNEGEEDMNIKEKFVLALTKEPQKSFRKAGITNGDDLLTDDGQNIFLSWLLHEKHADEFKTQVVDGLLQDQKKKDE